LGRAFFRAATVGILAAGILFAVAGLFRRRLSSPHTVGRAAPVIALRDEDTAVAIRDMLESAAGSAAVYCGEEILCGSDSVRGFYESRDFRPAWSRRTFPLEAADEMVLILDDVAADGLAGGQYHLAEIRRDLASATLGRSRAGKPPAKTLADLDMMLTDAFLLLGSHLASGLVNPDTMEAKWFIAPGRVDLGAVLAGALERGDVARTLANLRPRRSEYAGLREAWRIYTDIRDRGGWPAIPEGPPLKPKSSDPRVVVLRKRLAATGDIDDSDPQYDDLYDETVEASVRRYQARNGLEADGIVGGATLASLNVPIETRIRQIEVNLERWRWLPHDFVPRYLRVNIASFDLELIEGSDTILAAPVIVGAFYTRTPIFDGLMTYIEINPYWDVPTEISAKEIVPTVLKDPEYLDRMGFKLFSGWGEGAVEVDPASVDWANLGEENFPYHVRQEPGEINALGHFAFMFPNRFAVYLHDTPQKGLFGQASRSLSHGCIRVSKPVDLAIELLRGDPAWTRESLLQAAGTNKNRVVRLPRPIPVYLVYLTAWKDKNWEVNFREDIYGRDPELVRALTEPAPAKGPGGGSSRGKMPYRPE
jgi:murein L,D-transpeptidase YcbB/YkuD